MTDRYAADNFEVHELVNWYRREVRANQQSPASDWPWHYGRFQDGSGVPRAARLLFRERPDLMETVANPLSTAFKDWLDREMPTLLAPAQAAAPP
jgi:hypothetical protein